MKMLITGANGFLGQNLTLFFAEKEHDIIACNRGSCRIPERLPFQYYSADLIDEIVVLNMIADVQPDIVIHAAANSKPDECAANKDACLLQNVEATKYLLMALHANHSFKSLFIYISTDFVFGENGPHSENDLTDPLNFYGESKLMSEQLVEQSGLPYAIIRPVFIYGPVWEGIRPTFLHRIKDNLEAERQIKVVSDQIRAPTFVLDICKGIEAIINNRQQGIFHLAGKDLLSPYQMATAVGSFLGLNAALIENVTSESFIENVQRAKRSGLKINKAQSLLGYEPVSFEEGIALTFNNH